MFILFMQGDVVTGSGPGAASAFAVRLTVSNFTTLPALRRGLFHV